MQSRSHWLSVAILALGLLSVAYVGSRRTVASDAVSDWRGSQLAPE